MNVRALKSGVGAWGVGVCIAVATLSGWAAPAVTVQSIPIQHSEADGLLVDVDRNSIPELLVIDHHVVTVFRAGDTKPFATVKLPDGAAAVDVFDIDRDGLAEVLAVHGIRVLAFELLGNSDAVELFTLDTPLSASRPQPFPYAMAVEWEGAVAIALPRKTSIELRGLDGTPLTTFSSAGPDAGVDYGRPLSVRGIDPPQAGSANTLELRVSMIHDLVPELPDALGASAEPLGRPGTLSHAREATLRDPSTWPWFPLQPGTDRGARVRYALESPDFRDTLIRIWPAVDDTPEDEQKTFRYPGALVPYNEGNLPDFNGDGYTDLFLWKAPVPGGSVDALARAATGGAWPLTTTVHLYDPALGKFDARPSSPLKHQVAVPWFVTTAQGSPLRHVTFSDWDGDGRSDLGCSVEPNTFAIWFYRDGFTASPDVEHSFAEPLTALEALHAVPNAPEATLLFRSPRAFHTIRVARGSQ